MKRHIAIGSALALSLLLQGTSQGAPPATVQAEIGYLLQHVEDSGCDFNRNGTWYGGKRARAHLTLKYQYLVDHDEISTTNDFIDRAASKSSLTGVAYQIRCNGGTPVDSSRWMQDALAGYRHEKGAPAH